MSPRPLSSKYFLADIALSEDKDFESIEGFDTNLIKEIKDNYDINKNDVYYILELGTGSGQFSCYFLNFLTDLLKDNNKEDIKFCYVMTDFTYSNLDFWKDHPKLKKFVKEGVLDFAIYNYREANNKIHFPIFLIIIFLLS